MEIVGWEGMGCEYEVVEMMEDEVGRVVLVGLVGMVGELEGVGIDVEEVVVGCEGVGEGVVEGRNGLEERMVGGEIEVIIG